MQFMLEATPRRRWRSTSMNTIVTAPSNAALLPRWGRIKKLHLTIPSCDVAKHGRCAPCWIYAWGLLAIVLHATPALLSELPQRAGAPNIGILVTFENGGAGRQRMILLPCPSSPTARPARSGRHHQSRQGRPGRVLSKEPAARRLSQRSAIRLKLFDRAKPVPARRGRN